MLMPLLSFIKNSINLHLQRGDKVKSVHITSEDLEVIKKETLVNETIFGYPLITDAEYTHIEIVKE
jgi:hypothetical protein